MTNKRHHKWIRPLLAWTVTFAIGLAIWAGFSSSHQARLEADRLHLEIHTTELAERLNQRLAQELRGLEGLTKNRAILVEKAEASEALALFNSTNEFFDHVSVLDGQGRIVASSSTTQSAIADFSQEEWFKQVIRDGSLVRAGAQGASVKHSALTISLAMNSVKGNGPGALAAQVSVKKLESLLQSEARRSEKVQIFTEPFASKPNSAGLSAELYAALTRRAVGAHQDASGLWGYSPAGTALKQEWMILVSSTPTPISLPIWNWAVIVGTALSALVFAWISRGSANRRFRSSFEKILVSLERLEESGVRRQSLTDRHLENITSCAKKVQKLGPPFQSLQRAQDEISPALGLIEKSASGMRLSAEQARVILEGISATLQDIPTQDLDFVAPAMAPEFSGSPPPDLGRIQDWIEQIKSRSSAFSEFAFQTKLLSFNAAVEADRAGESGKGVLVVAEELGNLARMSAHAARELAKSLDAAPEKFDLLNTLNTKTPANPVSHSRAPAAVPNSRIIQLLESQRNSVKRLQDTIATILENSAVADEASHELHTQRDHQEHLLSQLYSMIEDLDQRSRQTLSDFARSPTGIEGFEQSISEIRQTISGPRPSSQDDEPTTKSQGKAAPQVPPGPPATSGRFQRIPSRKPPAREQAVHEALPHSRKPTSLNRSTRRTG
jgi:hypothetical protein